MKRFIVGSLMIFSLLWTSGCAQQSLASDKPKEQTAQQIETPKETQLQDSYDSILEYTEFITGEHFKTDRLNISKKDGYIHFEIRVDISTALQEIMLNTKEPFYFNITDFEGRDNLARVTTEPPLFSEGDLEKIQDGKYHVIKQAIKIRHDLTPEEVEELLLPENYELQLVASNKQIVAVIMGLDLNMIY